VLINDVASVEISSRALGNTQEVSLSLIDPDIVTQCSNRHGGVGWRRLFLFGVSVESASGDMHYIFIFLSRPEVMNGRA
jgi:hypothetical protein